MQHKIKVFSKKLNKSFVIAVPQGDLPASPEETASVKNLVELRELFGKLELGDFQVSDWTDWINWTNWANWADWADWANWTNAAGDILGGRIGIPGGGHGLGGRPIRPRGLS